MDTQDSPGLSSAPTPASFDRSSTASSGCLLVRSAAFQGTVAWHASRPATCVYVFLCVCVCVCLRVCVRAHVRSSMPVYLCVR